jgi:hypothetical protein
MRKQFPYTQANNKTMKKLLLLVILSASMAGMSFSQPHARKYGIELNQFIAGSGFGTGSELQLFAADEKGKKISVGLYYDHQYRKIGGLSVSFLKMLRSNKRANLPVLEPYVFYNFIYRKTTIVETNISENYSVAIGTYKSMEHHLGMGLRTNITKHLYIKGELGYGIYLGSIMKPSKPDEALNESFGTNGTGLLAKVGIGIFF